MRDFHWGLLCAPTAHHYLTAAAVFLFITVNTVTPTSHKCCLTLLLGEMEPELWDKKKTVTQETKEDLQNWIRFIFWSTDWLAVFVLKAARATTTAFIQYLSLCSPSSKCFHLQQRCTWLKHFHRKKKNNIITSQSDRARARLICLSDVPSFGSTDVFYAMKRLVD